MKVSHLLIPLITITVLQGGCDKLLGTNPEPSPALAPPPVPLPVAPQMPVVPQAPIASLPVAAVVPFQWTETPAFNLIPDTPIGGVANARQFLANTVIFEPGEEGWRMIISDTILSSPTGLITDGQTLYVDLPTTPQMGMNSMRPMEGGGGFFQINNNPADPTSTITWKADNAWALEITKWEIKDHDPSGPAIQHAGVASGRIALCYKGSDGIQNSWVAGKFENVIVRYMNKPFGLNAKPASTGGNRVAGPKHKIPAGYLPETPPNPKGEITTPKRDFKRSLPDAKKRTDTSKPPSAKKPSGVKKKRYPSLPGNLKSFLNSQKKKK